MPTVIYILCNLNRLLLFPSPMSATGSQVRRAAGDAAFSMFTNQGQSCCASSSIFVHETVYDKFIEYSKELAEKLVVGDPFGAGVTQGSLVNKENFERVLEYIESGKQEGARLVCGGYRVGKKGYFVKPTIFADVTDDMKIATDEVKFPFWISYSVFF
jgi:aldehyde dehydrogenase (NAD+)